MTWLAIGLAIAGCYGAKLAGLAAPARVLEGRRLQRFAAARPVALLAALIALQTFSSGRHLGVDARVAGVAVAAVAVLARAPFLAVVVLAAATTAGLRLLS